MGDQEEVEVEEEEEIGLDITENSSFMNHRRTKKYIFTFMQPTFSRAFSFSTGDHSAKRKEEIWAGFTGDTLETLKHF